MAFGDTQTINGAMAVYQPNRPIETVSLSRLIDFSIQRTYHELIVLTELLPRKSDMERKIEIVTFANRTRQLFVRLLALVKWAGSASKVEKCSTIVSFLDKQSMLFTETADILAKMSRESLVQARLPSFQLPSAVEVLTSGTYTRLPACIRDKIVPPDPITADEKKSTLSRLNQIIQQRLVSSQLPKQMRNSRIEFGRVVFHVPFEFELTLTLMGDSNTLPWRVLDLAILVEDKDTGEGKDLVHYLQNTFLQHMVQAKLTENPGSLMEAYEILHSFCLSLQLEVLHAQTIRLSRERLGDFIRVEEYMAGARLTISYWRDQSYNDGKGCRLTIEMNAAHPGEPLSASHSPELGERETRFANRAIRSDTLSIEKLLIYSTHERAKEILCDLQEQLQKSNEDDSIDYELKGSPPALSISYLRPCMTSEKLILSVDALTGQLLIHVPQFEQCPMIDDLQVSAKKDTNRLIDLIRRLRIWVCKERHKKTAEFVGVQVQDSLPIVNADQHPQLQTNDKSGMLFVMLSKHPQHCLMVKFDSCNYESQSYFIMLLEPCIDMDGSTSSSSASDTIAFTSTKSLYTLNSIFELNIDCILQPRYGESRHSLMYNDYEPMMTTAGKRKRRSSMDDSDQPQKRTSPSSFYIAEFAYIINFCEEKLAYGLLCKQLQARNLCHVVRSSTEYGCSHYVDLIRLPAENASTRLLHKQMLSCNIRLQSKNKLWLVTFRMALDSRLAEWNRSNQIKTNVFLVYDCSHSGSTQLQQMLDELLDEWQSMAKLYEIFTEFLLYHHEQRRNNMHFGINQASQFNDFDVCSYSFRKLVLAYGPSKQYTISLTWKSNENRFVFTFGVCGTSNGNSNPHVLVATQLQHEFNQNLSIASLVHLLNSTFQPIATIHYLNSIPLLGIINSRPQVPVQTFCLVPQSSTHIRILYRNIYCIDVLIQSDGCVAIRDGAYSIFDKSKVLEELTPIQSLKAFLNKFGDKSHTRRHSQNEDDNPPSPVAQLDPHSLDSGMSTSGYMISKSNINSPLPALSSDHGNNSTLSNALRGTPGLHTSNPNTPASPHTSLLSQTTGYVPSPGLPEPSPGNMFPVNSPISSIHAPSPSPAMHQPQPSPAPPNSNSSNFNISMPSPVSSGWPNSPSLSRPSPSRPVQSPAQPIAGSSSTMVATSGPHLSRVMPPRSWAAAVPTLLTQSAFEAMCKPNATIESSSLQTGNSVYATLSQLERFLGCVFMRKNLQRFIQNDDTFSLIHTPEPGVIQFKNENMQFKISLHPLTMQSLHVKIQPLPDCKVQWTSEELEILERFFESKVVCAPFKPNSFFAYGRLLNTPFKILKDCIQLMRLELYPDRGLKWSVSWCLTIPPATQMMLGSPGMSAMLYKNTTLLFFMQFTRNMQGMTGEAQSIVVPFVYEIHRNSLQVPSRESAFSSVPIFGLINQILARCSEYMHSPDCIIFNYIHEIMRSDLISA